LSDEMVHPQLEKLLRQHLPDIGAGAVIRRDDPLANFGLDSFGMVRLVLDLERVFALDFPEELLVPETFATAASVADAIANLRPDLERTA
jgi:acyl carrier protein